MSTATLPLPQIPTATPPAPADHLECPFSRTRIVRGTDINARGEALCRGCRRRVMPISNTLFVRNNERLLLYPAHLIGAPAPKAAITRPDALPVPAAFRLPDPDQPATDPEPAPKRDRRKEKALLPEQTHYRDDGCEIAPRCLDCPIPMCRYDLPPKRAGALQREAQLRTYLSAGNSADEAAELMGVSRRTVFRLKQFRATTEVEAMVSRGEYLPPPASRRPAKATVPSLS